MVYQHAMCEIHQMKWKWRWIWNSDVVFHFRCEGYCCREVWDILFVDWSTENTNIFCRFHCKRLPWTEETILFVFMTTSSLSSLLRPLLMTQHLHRRVDHLQAVSIYFLSSHAQIPFKCLSALVQIPVDCKFSISALVCDHLFDL